MYIRTKDGIYEVLSEYDTPENTTLISNPVAAFDVKETPRTYSGASIRIIYSNEVISKSENLDELCDEGVIEVKFGSTGYIAHFNKHIDELKKFLKYLEECQPVTKDEILNVYGAIWVDGKCLIYVAKMDNEGKLVLI